MKNSYLYLISRKRKSIFKSSFAKILLMVCCLFFAVDVFSQQPIKVSGSVVDNIGEPIIGATILIVGQNTGTVTDLDGKFALTAPSNGSIQVSFVGHTTQKVAISNQETLHITLVENMSNLDEVVVIGYGTAKRRDLTGAVASVKSEDITIAPTSNVMEAIQGRVSGMDIMKTSGQVGKGVDILMRGSRSIYGSNAPLFIIDGIIGESYSQLNPNDVESIDILKDGSSTAIYGSAGANGVVIITTKRGKAGKATVNFDAYYGFSGTPQFFHGMQGDEWTTYQREAYKTKNGQYPADMGAILTDAKKLEAYNQGKWIDWVDEVAGNAATNQKYSLSVTGGSDKTKVYASLMYEQQEGLLRNDNQNSYAARLNIDQTLFPWAKVGFTSNLNYAITNSGVKNTFTKSISAFPLGDAYTESGEINHQYTTSEYTPMGDFIKDQFVNNNRNTYLNTNAYMELTPLKGLSIKTVLSATLENTRLGQYWGAQANANRPTYAGSPHAEVSNKYGYKYLWDNILSYNKTIMGNHDLGLTLVSSYSKIVDESNKAAGSGQLLDSWSFYSLGSATSKYTESNFKQRQVTSYATRLNYSFKGKYIASFSNRWDGVSWFSDGLKWDAFPSGALAWRISDEDFMANTKDWLSNLKLRVGYGKMGNNGGLDAYSSKTNLILYTANGISLDGKIAPFTQYTGTFGSTVLGWEKTYNTNVGLDFAILNGRIDASIEMFKTKTEGLLFKRTKPITDGATGWGSPLGLYQNLAETSNKGLEITINSRNIRTKEFTWNTNLTFSWNTEKIESLPSGNLIGEQLLEGYPIKSFYNYKYAGIWATDTPTDMLTGYAVRPGSIKIETVPQIGANGSSDDGVHKYSEKDKQVLGHANPDYIVGLNNSFTYKGFDFTVFTMARYGQTIQSDLLGWYSAKTDNQIAGADYWTENNQGAYFPAAGSDSYNSTVMPSLKFRDGSFIKVKNITLGYTLPVKFSRRALMEKCRFYATAYNPFLYVKDKQLKGTDPETNGSDNFPLYKQFVFGINITF